MTVGAGGIAGTMIHSGVRIGTRTGIILFTLHGGDSVLAITTRGIIHIIHTVFITDIMAECILPIMGINITGD